MARKTAAEVHLELAVHEKECSERWKTAFKNFDEIDKDVKEINQKVKKYNDFLEENQRLATADYRTGYSDVADYYFGYY